MQKILSVSDFRKNLFSNIDYVYKSGNSILVQKAGIPLVVITQIKHPHSIKNLKNTDQEVSDYDLILDNETPNIKNFYTNQDNKLNKTKSLNTSQVLRDSKGIFKNDSDFDSKKEEREELERKLMQKIKELW